MSKKIIVAAATVVGLAVSLSVSTGAHALSSFDMSATAHNVAQNGDTQSGAVAVTTQNGLQNVGIGASTQTTATDGSSASFNVGATSTDNLKNTTAGITAGHVGADGSVQSGYLLTATQDYMRNISLQGGYLSSDPSGNTHSFNGSFSFQDH